MTDLAKARENMVDCQIHPMGIIYPGVLDTFMTVPREVFVPANQQGVAYTDEDLACGDGRYLMDPATHARMLQALEPKSHEVVLDVGGLNGYSSAILSPLVSTVIMTENKKSYIDRASENWQKLEVFNATAIKQPLAEGCKEYQPYDMIFVGGAVAEIPESLTSQLAEGGRMVLIHKQPGQVMGEALLIRATGKGNVSSYKLFEAGGHYLPGFEPNPGFEF